MINDEELARLNLSSSALEVLQRLTQGRSNAEIADNLFLSVSTVKTHVSSLFVKMNVRSRLRLSKKRSASGWSAAIILCRK